MTSDPTAIEDEELKAVKYANLHRAIDRSIVYDCA